MEKPSTNCKSWQTATSPAHIRCIVLCLYFSWCTPLMTQRHMHEMMACQLQRPQNQANQPTKDCAEIAHAHVAHDDHSPACPACGHVDSLLCCLSSLMLVWWKHFQGFKLRMLDAFVRSPVLYTEVCVACLINQNLRDHARLLFVCTASP